ncbi:MAG: hypothetical protein ABH821_02695 [archaeon]
MLKDFVGKPCNNRTAFEFLPKKKMQLDFDELALKFDKSTEIEVETPFLMMLKVGENKVSLFRSGKILVKGIKSESVARSIASKIVKYF